MPSRPELVPTPMERVAVVAPTSRWRRVLVEVADRGLFEPDREPAVAAGPATELAERLIATDGSTAPMLSMSPIDLDAAVRDGQLDLVAGEASLERCSGAAREVGRCRILPGWVPRNGLVVLRDAVAPLGGSVAPLPGRRGLEPPTAHLDGRAAAAFRPLVTTYATVPYRDIDPTAFATVAYLVMFGMMFGDVAHGLAIVLVGMIGLTSNRRTDDLLRRAAPFLIGAGAMAMVFGLLYGEAFGPTGLVPTLWLRPLDEPEVLLVMGLVVGGVLLALTFGLAIVDRWREGGVRFALYAPSGIAGAVLLAGTSLAVVGVATDRSTWWLRSGLVLLAAGTLLVFVGLLGAGDGGAPQAVVELFDTLLRLGSNLVSFTRLAAFGLTHAVMTEVVWDGSVALWGRGVAGAVGAIVLFVAGNAAAFALGALVAAIQALRLEYYELFSRLFLTSGRPFDPWHVPVRREESP